MLFNTEEFNQYIKDDFNFEANFIRSIRYWDKAGTTDGGKYTAGVKMAELKPLMGQPRYLIQDVVRGRWAAEKRETVIEQTAMQDGPNCMQWIEQEPGSGGKESAENTVKRLGKKGLICTAERPVGDKFYRADPFSVAWNRGQVWMVRAPWNKPFLDELQDFSPSSEYKDQVDAAGAAYSKLNGTRGGTW
jgi:predicted phage terminase large subunit-like protein